MPEAIPGPQRPTPSQSRIAPSWPRSIAIAGGGGLVVGVLTSIGQAALPDEIRSLANAASPWSAAAFALAAVAGGRETLRSAILAAGSLLTMLAGYSLASTLRGFPVGASTTLFWVAAAVVVGPALGVGAAWSRGDRRAESGRGRGDPGVDPRRGGRLRPDGHRRHDLTRLLDRPAPSRASASSWSSERIVGALPPRPSAPR